MALISQNPFNQEILMEVPEWSNSQIENSLAKSSSAFNIWRKTSFQERSKYMMNLSTILREKRHSLAKLASLEMGMPISQAVSDIEKSAQIAEYYCIHGEEILKNEFIDSNPNQYISYEPIGTILHIAPWNYPFYLALRPVIPAIIAGNSVLLKHASNMLQVAMSIQDVFNLAGFPEGVFTSLLITSSKVEPIIQDDRVNMITLIGSEYAGIKVGEVAGSCLKKTLMELGGNDPLIVLNSADIKEAAKQAAQSRLRNQGQSCNAAKRFIVQKDIAEEFTAEVLSHFENQEFGEPLNYKTNFGPLASKSSLEDIQKQVQQSLDLGAKILTGGHGNNAKQSKKWEAFLNENSDGYFYPPTILTNVNHEMDVVSEEVFGPVVPIIVVESEEEAIREANNSKLGLGASLWTTDEAQIKRIIPELECGMVCVNSMVRSNIKMPFGGVKKSGFGRELGSHGMKEFVNVKSVVISNLK